MMRENYRPGLELAWLADGPPDDRGSCGFFWLGGFMSDMTGSKAEAIAALARRTGRPSFRFDYSGHGASGGVFTEGTISAWLDQTVHMFERHTSGPRIVIGSSMGGWLALLLDRALGGRRIAGLILIAPAVDMTMRLMWDKFPQDVRDTLVRDGVWHRPSAYGNPYPITFDLIEDGRRHLLLDGAIETNCPVHILQGDADPEVPWQHAMETYERIRAPDLRLTLIKGGDHRLSSPLQLEFMAEAADQLARRAR